MKTHSYNRASHVKKGFASLLTVTSVGVGLLIILISMYENTVESQAVQGKNMLRGDYQQREDAFLRSLTSILPNRAMRGMQDDSWQWSTRKNLRWRQIIDDAITQSNAEIAVDADIASSLGIDSMRSGNVGNTSLSYGTIVKPGFSENYWQTVSSGTNRPASRNYPPPLETTSGIEKRDSRYPIVSHTKYYGSSASGWVQEDVSKYPQFNKVLAPSLHFNYQTGNTLIAKHNWWVFKLNFADQNKNLTKLETRPKYFLVSLYEIPSQLPINGASYTALGKHSDGSEWSNISIAGTVFGQRIKTEGSFSSDGISSRKGVELSADTTVGNVTASSVGANPFSSNAREKAQSKGEIFPISSASDGGGVAFVPINRGLEFYDRYVTTNSSINSANAVSKTAWDYYSIGAMQCAMRLDVIDVAAADNQTPTAIRFTYFKNGSAESVEFYKGDTWPDPDSSAGQEFPFHTQTTADGRPAMGVYAERLATYLADINADPLDTNHSLSINVDYVSNASIRQPAFPCADDDLAIILLDSEDMTDYTRGFSLITNMRLIVADDTNIVETTAPADMVLPAGTKYYPPLSMFAPEKRYGDSSVPIPVQIEGQLGSVAKDNSSPVRIADLKSGTAGEVVPGNISATLKPITHPAALPPINMMNWMVVIREIHPDFNPGYQNPDDGTTGP